MSSNTGAGFKLPQRPKADPDPKAVEAFIGGASRPAFPPEAPSAAVAEPTLEELDHSTRTPQWPVRMTKRETEAMAVVLNNVTGYRSKHDYVIRALQKQLEADYERVTGKKIVLSPDGEG